MINLVFTKDSIYLKDNPEEFVMMDWERSVMKKHAEIVCRKGGDILEIGFGMGISATYIQEFGCNSHTIVEYHPVVYENLLEWASDKPNVIPIFGNWEIKSPYIKKRSYDGIFYDPYNFTQTNSFRNLVIDVIKPGGVFSYFEAMGKDVFKFGPKLKLEEIYIEEEIPKNLYHNDKRCLVPYVIFD